MNQPWKVIVVLIGIFAAGGVTGGFVTLRACRDKFLNRPVPEEWEPKHLKKLSERLSLTPEQKEQVRPIIRRSMEQLNRLRNQSMAETRVVVEGMQREISEQLTPEQRLKFEQMNRELREAREARERHEREKKEKAKVERPAEAPAVPEKAAPAPAVKP
jgi:Spy/CpxP family protein refolding chaperone